MLMKSPARGDLTIPVTQNERHVHMLLSVKHHEDHNVL